MFDDWLRGHRIMVVEDDFLIAALLMDELKDAGADHVEPMSTAHRAHDAIENEAFTAAILDINLGIGADFTVAANLLEKNIPFVFLSGYSREVIPLEFQMIPLIAKPYSSDLIKTKLRPLLVH